jgi:hypothetical protein
MPVLTPVADSGAGLLLVVVIVGACVWGFTEWRRLRSQSDEGDQSESSSWRGTDADRMAAVVAEDEANQAVIKLDAAPGVRGA